MGSRLAKWADGARRGFLGGSYTGVLNSNAFPGDHARSVLYWSALGLELRLRSRRRLFLPIFSGAEFGVWRGVTRCWEEGLCVF